jgi:segregation and condensation protein A
MSVNIKIDNFEGPFDLLLHLIKKNEMDIYNIKIYDITSQYIEYLKAMEEMDLEITSEFIVIAATLIELKSRQLLPKEKKETGNEELADPEQLLIMRLLEYNKFKSAAEYFKLKMNLSGEVYSKMPEIISDYKGITGTEILKSTSLEALHKIYEKLVLNYKKKENTESLIGKKISTDAFKVKDKMEVILNKLKITKRFLFNELLEDCSYKLEAIVTFLGLLELIKTKKVNIFQEGNFSEIYVEGIDYNE